MTLNIWDVLLSSGTNPYVQQSPLVPDVVPCDHDKDVNLPHVEFATPAYVTRRCERQFYEWTVVDFSESSQECSLVCYQWYHLPFRFAQQHLEDNQSHALSGEYEKINPAEAVGFFGRKNPQHAFLRMGSKAVGPMS